MEALPMVTEGLEQMERVLRRASRRLRLVEAVRPLNEAVEKEAFLSGRCRRPRFRYRKPSPPSDLGLSGVRLPDCPVGRILEAQRRRLLKLHAALQDPAPGQLLDISREMYGAPAPSLTSTARRILQELPPVDPPWEELGQTKSRLRQALLDYGLHGWSIEDAPGDFTAARALEKKVFLTTAGPVAQGTGERLAVHEVGVHAVRAENGFAQPLKLLGYGLPGYERTEEGLAVYAELLTGTLSPRVLRKYAARALAVAGLESGWDFARTFEELRELGQSPGHAWEATLRAHRGGGFIKDHVYLEGLLEMMTFAEKGGDLTLLFVGKVGLQHLDLVRDLLWRGAIRPPGIVPSFIHAEPPANEVYQLLRKLR